MAAELGDALAGPRWVVTKDSDGTNMSAGDAVTVDSNNEVSPTGDGDDLFGVVLEATRDGVDLSDLSQGDPVSVLIFGGVVANAGGSVTEGDPLETSGTNGQLAQNSSGTERDVDEGGAQTYTIASATALTLSDSGGSTPAGESLAANEAAIFVGR